MRWLYERIGISGGKCVSRIPVRQLSVLSRSLQYTENHVGGGWYPYPPPTNFSGGGDPPASVEGGGGNPPHPPALNRTLSQIRAACPFLSSRRDLCGKYRAGTSGMVLPYQFWGGGSTPTPPPVFFPEGMTPLPWRGMGRGYTPCLTGAGKPVIGGNLLAFACRRQQGGGGTPSPPPNEHAVSPMKKSFRKNQKSISNRNRAAIFPEKIYPDMVGGDALGGSAPAAGASPVLRRSRSTKGAWRDF